VVTHAPIDGVQLRLTSGVKAGERVVTRGASLINQIR
jgi:membrane fusion protein, heavy metal efflux system